MDIGNKLFESISLELKKLALEANLTEEEAQNLVNIMNSVNTLRESYMDRRLQEIISCNTDIEMHGVYELLL